MSEKLKALLDRLFDPSVEFDDLDLSAVPAEDLVYLIQALRAWGFMSKGHALELSETLTEIDQFAGRKAQVFFLAPGLPNVH